MPQGRAPGARGNELGLMSMLLPRVVFVDDDAAIRRLVASVLEDLPIDLLCCETVAQARAALRERPARLLITDLMLPVETGFDLLESLAADPGLRAGAQLVVFSAGLHADTRVRLAGLGVWRELSKPVSLQALEACVSDALALTAGAAPADAVAAAPAALPPLRAHEQQAVAAQFGGDAVLYLAFRDQVRAQLPQDAEAGGQALARREWPALHRLAHSLKGVLALLGDEAGAAQALVLEQAAAAADAAACQQAWPVLLQHLRTTQPPNDDCK